MAKFILGGRMGDLIHMMYVVANTPGRHDLYITDRRELHSDGFIYPLQQTIEELKPVLMYQDYVKSVQAYEGPVTEAIEGEYINLNMWRRYAYTKSWTVLLSGLYGISVDTPLAWLKSPISNVKYNKLVHCSTPSARKGNWDGVDLSGCVFIGTLQEYQNFNRPELPHIVPHSLAQMVTMINSCNSFIGNQSLPLAIAHALDKPRTGVLNEVDAAAYVGEEKIFNNFSYVL